ncbi:equatorin [Echinops telfairi]|uniref:Equatorin n=1 Tax=Echinops telfairi TaxID=9371 RepID=A0ABM0ZST6_ECHTE|nr:equatorin [Echinops telfairi]
MLSPTLPRLPPAPPGFSDSPLLKEENKQQGENKDKVPANEQNGKHLKDVKEYTFTTQNINGTGPEISLRATTDINFLLKNSLTSTETSTTKSTEGVTENPPGDSTAEEGHVEGHDNNLRKTTKSQNEPEFWTMLEKAINGTPRSHVDIDEKDQLFNPIPSSDLNPPGAIAGTIQDIKLRLMLGVSLMSLFLFLVLLTLCAVTMYKLRKLAKKECDAKYSVNPNLAQMSYFRPSEGVSDTSFSKSAASSTFLGNSPSAMKKLGPKKEKSKTMVETVLPAPEDPEGLEVVDANEEQNVEMLP